MRVRELKVWVILSVVAPSTILAQGPVTPSGAGSEASPYQISQLGHLVWMGDNVGSSSGKYFTMQNDIDASTTAGWNSGAGFAPIGTDGAPFRGVFNGNGKVISNLTINRPTQDPAGLFGRLDLGGVVKDLGLTGNAVTGLRRVGGLIGVNVDGTLRGCYVTGSVTGSGDSIGGLVGYNNGTMSGCYATGPVTGGDSSVGGLVGGNMGKVIGSHATGTVTGGTDVGGLVGWNNGPVSGCFAAGPVTGTGSSIGGLVGNNNGTVSHCYATSTVTGYSNVGGFIGANWPNPGTVSRCYATGSASGHYSVGGLAGWNGGAVSICYATGAVTGDWTIGGLLGSNGGTVSSSYWNVNTSGQATSGGGGTGRTTAQMKQQATFVGWDFTDAWTITEDATYPLLRPVTLSYITVSGETEVSESSGSQYTCTAYHSDGSSLNVSSSASWSENSTYASIGGSSGYLTTTAVSSDQPCRITSTYGGRSATYDITICNGPSGTGTAANPYQINQLGHLVWMGATVGASAGKYYTLQNDIDASATAGWNGGAGFAPIGTDFTTMFSGTFNGNGKVISNLTINRPTQDSLGLFGYFNGTVKDLGLTAVSITGGPGGSVSGGLVGFSYGTVSRCYSSGTVTGGYSVGGLVGENRGTISWCYASVTVTTGADNAGGLLGSNDGTVINCYAKGAVTGNWGVGGLMGSNHGTASNCYATGVVTGGSEVGGLVGDNSISAEVSNSYWDTETSGQASSNGGGTGKTTAQMKQQATFVGWDFINLWSVDEEVTYPLFAIPPQMFSPAINPDATIVIRWASVTNQTYTVYRSTNLLDGFSVLRSGIPGTPPVNTYIDTLNGAGAKFWKVTTQQ